MKKEIFTPAKFKDACMGLIMFWLNAVTGCLGTYLGSCLDVRNGEKKFNAGHFVMGVIQCVLCPFTVGYCLSIAWGTCMYLKSKNDMDVEWEFLKDGVKNTV